MPILTSDIKFKYSVNSGPGNSTAQANPNASLGGYVSTSQWYGTGVIDDLFNDITGQQNANDQVDYRCIFIHNTNGSDTFLSPAAWFSNIVAGATTKAVGLDPTGATVASAGTAQALNVAYGTVAPVGVSFSTPVSFAAGLALPALPPNYVVAVWLQRTAANTAALNNDGFTLSVEGSTSA